MHTIFLTGLVFLVFTTIGAVPQRLKPQCRSNVCDDRPECPRTSCSCLFASRADCSIYYQCVNGKPYQYRCSPGLMFNAETLTCDYSFNVNCSFSTTESTTIKTTTEEPTTTKTTTDEPTTTKTTTEEPTTTKTTTAEPTTTIATTEEPTTTKTTTQEPTTTKTTTQEPTTTKTTTQEPTTTKTTTEEPTTTKTTTEEPTTTKTTTEEPTTTKTTTEEPTTTRTTTEEPTTTKTTTEEPTTPETTTLEPTTDNQAISTPANPSSDFLCPSRFGLFPDPKSCFRFYHCSHWIPYHKWCPSDLHFNPKLKVCDWPYRAGCDTYSSTPFEPDSPTTPSTNDTYGTCDCDCCELPVTSDCNAYVLCINKVAFMMRCSPGLYFNPMTGTCDYKENVVCAQDDFTCPEASGRYLLPGSCSYFIECHDGKKTTKKCPEGLQFNQSSEMCSWLGSCSDQQQDNPSTIITNNSICNGCDYCFKPFLKDCSRYVRCFQNIATEESCAAGLFFNPENEMCDHDYNVECPEPQPQPECPQSFGFFPYPGECGMYLQCVNGIAIVKNCPGILHFDPVRKHCDYPWSAGCSDSGSVPTPEPTPEIIDCDCDCCLKPAGTDCRSFVLCINKIGFVRSCSSGLFFNPKTENCDFADNVDCSITPEIPGYICPEYEGLFPHPEDCHKFLHCAHGFPYVKDCPSNLHFNPKLKVCDWPYSAGCQDSQTTGPPTEDSDMPCDLCDSCFIPDERDCASYIYCRHGKGYRLRCTENLVFNPDIEACDLVTNVKCPNPPQSQCLKPDGLFPAKDCSQFIHCSNGIAYLKDCPDGLQFNPQILVCDWPDNVKCGEIPVQPTPPDNGTGASNITCNCDCCFLPYNNDCSKYVLCLDGYMHIGQCSRGLLFNPNIQNCDKAERVTCGEVSPSCPEPNGLFPNSDQCSSYIKCSDGRSVVEYCQNGTHFSDERKQCLDPCKAKCDNSYDCSTKPENVTPTPRPTICLEPYAFYPVTNDCTSYYVCSNGQPQRVKCPYGLHYNAEYEVCEDPCDANCDKSLDCGKTPGSSPVTKPSTTPSSSTPNPQCSQGDGLFPAEGDCSSFYICSGGIPYLKKCPSGLHFSNKHQNCQYPCEAKCNTSIDCSTPFSSPKTTPSPIPSTPDPHCPNGDGLFPNEDDCSSFYQCSGGRAYLIKCPPGLHFSFKHQVCEYPCEAKCNSSVDCTTPGTSPKTMPPPTPSPSTPDPHCLQGDGLFSVEGDCSSFYHCSGGRSYLMKCSQGLHFSYKDQICEYPCAAKCDTSIDCLSPTPRTTTPSSHCPTAEGLHPVYGDCTAFYLCSNGKEYLIHCPPGLHYSEKDETCEKPCVAQCNASLACEISTEPASPSTPHQISPECDEPDGLFSNPDDCASFFQCSNGRSHLIQCPSGLHFSPDDAACERPCVAGCDISIECIPEYPDTKGNCTCEGCYLPDPSDCSAFYFCDNGRLAKGYCPFETLFSKISSVCEVESTVDCEANGDPSMCPERFGFFPYPGDCKKFVHCDNGVAHIKECQDNLEYDPLSKVCTKPKGYCGDIVLDPNCPEPTGMFPDPTNCSLFYHCEHGVAYLKRCSPPLMFNPDQGVCDWPDNVACGRSTIETSTPSVTPKYNFSTPSPTPSVVTPSVPPCYEVPGVICPCACRVPTYDECSSYFQCQEDGTACKRYCPEGLYFNKIEMVCDLPENVKCRDFFFTSIRRAKQLSHH